MLSPIAAHPGSGPPPPVSAARRWLATLGMLLALSVGAPLLLPSSAQADVPRPPGPGCQRCSYAALGSSFGGGSALLATGTALGLAALLWRRDRRDD